MRALLGWLRARSATAAWQPSQPSNEEEARRPNRDETISSANVHGSSIKAILARFGIRAFKPNLRKAAEKLEALHTAEGMPLPERSRAELRRNLGRLVNKSTRSEQERLRQLSVVPDTKKGPVAMVRLLSRIVGVGIETADMLVK